MTYATEFSGWTRRRGCIELSIEFDSSLSTPSGDSSSDDDILGLLWSGLMMFDCALVRGVDSRGDEEECSGPLFLGILDSTSANGKRKDHRCRYFMI